MIKIDPLLPTDSARIQELISWQESLPCTGTSAQLSGLTFWQHWLPCNWHLFPSAYVAKEDGAVIGLIALSSLGKSASCWRIDHLVVHPDHRGRGLATELLRYVFALFGGQGVGQFVAYASDANSSALRLLGSCGFKRAAKLTAFTTTNTAKSTSPNEHATQTGLIKATSEDSNGLFQLFQDVLPPDIRIVFNYVLDDFKVIDSPTYNKVRNKLIAPQHQYWLWKDPQRQTITSAMKLSLDREGNAQLEFAVHPGWKHQASDFVAACLQQLKHIDGVRNAVACIFDFDSQLITAATASGMETIGHYCLLTREHWVRAKKEKRASISVPSIAKPAINFPI
jgi:GNAT superfamily N-acetyltransferase